MTSAECREAIVRHVAARGGWVPIAELSEWLRTQLHLSRSQSEADLRTLVLSGRLERRPTVDAVPGSWIRHYEYRVPLGQHSGRSGAQRRTEGGP